MIFRIYHRLLGGHVHCRFFAGRDEGALGKCGELCMRVEEFEAYRDASKFINFIKVQDVDAKPKQNRPIETE